MTIILTTHYLDEAENLADRICILNKGKVILTESVKKLTEAHGKNKLEEIFLNIISLEKE